MTTESGARTLSIEDSGVEGSVNPSKRVRRPTGSPTSIAPMSSQRIPRVRGLTVVSAVTTMVAVRSPATTFPGSFSASPNTAPLAPSVSMA
jgi:hypothetical protein